MLPLGLGYVEGGTHDYWRHGTTTLYAALDTANGKVLAQCRPRHRHQEYLGFLREIEKNVPKKLDVHVIVDNYATHKHLRVRRWFATRPRFHVHFTPTYAPWLNQVAITTCSIPTVEPSLLSGPPQQNRSLLKSSDYVKVFPGQHTNEASPQTDKHVIVAPLVGVRRMCYIASVDETA